MNKPEAQQRVGQVVHTVVALHELQGDSNILPITVTTTEGKFETTAGNLRRGLRVAKEAIISDFAQEGLAGTISEIIADTEKKLEEGQEVRKMAKGKDKPKKEKKKKAKKKQFFASLPCPWEAKRKL